MIKENTFFERAQFISYLLFSGIKNYHLQISCHLFILTVSFLFCDCVNKQRHYLLNKTNVQMFLPFDPKPAGRIINAFRSSFIRYQQMASSSKRNCRPSKIELNFWYHQTINQSNYEFINH